MSIQVLGEQLYTNAKHDTTGPLYSTRACVSMVFSSSNMLTFIKRCGGDDPSHMQELLVTSFDLDPFQRKHCEGPIACAYQSMC